MRTGTWTVEVSWADCISNVTALWGETGVTCHTMTIRNPGGHATSNFTEAAMLHVLAQRWWALAVRGAVAILFGLLTWLVPGVTFLWLVFLFGAYALLDGVFNVVASFRGAKHHWALLLEG